MRGSCSKSEKVAAGSYPSGTQSSSASALSAYGRAAVAVIGAYEFVLWRSVHAVRLSGVPAQRVLGFVKSHFRM